jgi:NDP-sugar pyrophosphorylase family protein
MKAQRQGVCNANKSRAYVATSSSAAVTMLNIVVPMAGRGQRFSEAGFSIPKPLIPIHGTPMFQVVLNNLRPKRAHRFIFLVLSDHVAEFQIDSVIKKLERGCEVLVVDTVTQGQACTVLLAKHLIDTDQPLMIANCDQWVSTDINQYLASMDQSQADGLIMTMWGDDPKWSFVQFDEQGRITGVVEKQVVSNEATTGIYNYRHGRHFVEAAERMIAANLRVNNEFYVAPAYNEMIRDGRTLTVFNVGRQADGFYGLGIPSELDAFQRLALSHEAARLEGPNLAR